MTEYLINPHCDPTRRYPPPTLAPRSFHRRLPEYEVTPLHNLTALAAELGIGRLYIKDESRRLTLPAFKLLGASWAVFRWASEQLGHTPWDWEDIDDLRRILSPLGRRHLVTATDGNHGRGVAKTAAWLGWGATVFMPAGTVPARITAIEQEGATVTVVDGSYDNTVAVAHDFANSTPGALLVQDTSWSGYEQIPGWIIDGYSTPLWEIEDQRRTATLPDPTLVIAPVGVGSLAAAMTRHFRRYDLDASPTLIGVEPRAASCLFASLKAGESVSVPQDGTTIMAGLNCGTLATLAWPVLRDGLDATLALEDSWAVKAMGALKTASVESGESGASSLAGLMALCCDPILAEVKDRFGIGPDTVALVLNTEGITDPDSVV